MPHTVLWVKARVGIIIILDRLSIPNTSTILPPMLEKPVGDSECAPNQPQLVYFIQDKMQNGNLQLLHSSDDNV